MRFGFERRARRSQRHDANSGRRSWIFRERRPRDECIAGRNVAGSGIDAGCIRSDEAADRGERACCFEPHDRIEPEHTVGSAECTGRRIAGQACDRRYGGRGRVARQVR